MSKRALYDSAAKLAFSLLPCIPLPPSRHSISPRAAYRSLVIQAARLCPISAHTLRPHVRSTHIQ